MPRPSNTEVTFWNKVSIKGKKDCWEWRGRVNVGNHSGKCKYGRLDFGGEAGVYAHRVAYFIARPGRIKLRRGKRGLFVLHRCDNPVCCNPRHLFLGTHQENMRDMSEKGRAPSYTSIDSPRAKLSEDDVRWIRFLYATKRANKPAIALLYDVSLQTIKAALSGRHYADVV